MLLENLLLIIVSIIGAVSTYTVSVGLKAGPIKASAILSLFVAIIVAIIPKTISWYSLVENMPVVFMGASFIGMSITEIMPNKSQIALAGLVFGLIFINEGIFFKGYGGGLGTVACLSVLITIGVIKLLSKNVSLTQNK